MEIIWCKKFILDVECFLFICVDQGVGGFVLGLLFNMDGLEGLRVQVICVFVCNFVVKIDLLMILWDECLLIVVVMCIFLEVDFSCVKCVEVVDKMVVVFIL